MILLYAEKKISLSKLGQLNVLVSLDDFERLGVDYSCKMVERTNRRFQRIAAFVETDNKEHLPWFQQLKTSRTLGSQVL